MADPSTLDLSWNAPLRTTDRPVELAIFEAIAYADVFDYPLTAEEVHRKLGLRVSAERVGASLLRLVLDGRLLLRDGHYTLRGRESLIELRRRGARLAARMWPDGIRYGRRLAQLPFVRMVAITGSMALDNVEAAADIDYLVVARAGRVWVARALANQLRRRAGQERVRICPNYILSERSLVIEERNLYTAHELVQMVPVAGYAVYRRMMELNGWVRDFLPNAGPLPGAIEEPRRTPLAQLAEAVLRTPLGAALDRLERLRLARKMAHRAESLSEVVYSAERCKDHVHSHARRVLSLYAERLRAVEGW